LRILQLRSQRIRLLSKRLQLRSSGRRILREERIRSLRCSRRRVATPSLLQRRLSRGDLLLHVLQLRRSSRRGTRVIPATRLRKRGLSRLDLLLQALVLLRLLLRIETLRPLLQCCEVVRQSVNRRLLRRRRLRSHRLLELRLLRIQGLQRIGQPVDRRLLLTLELVLESLSDTIRQLPRRRLHLLLSAKQAVKNDRHLGRADLRRGRHL